MFFYILPPNSRTVKIMDKKTDKLIRRLISNAKKIQRAKYHDLEELYDLTKGSIYPENIAGLAESFGMMAVKLEAREYKLEQTINDLKETSEKLRLSNEKLEEYSHTLERRVAERTAEILRMAATDDLTQLHNRKEVLQRLRHELSKRKLADLSLIFLDIDHFKEVNDKYGHQAGDEVLRAVARILKETVREYDIPGRFGGEEFMIVMPDTKAVEAFAVARRIKRNLGLTPLKIGNRKLKLTSSFGIVSLADNAKEISSKLGVKTLKDIASPENWREKEKLQNKLCEILIKASDDAMYKAKRSSCLSCGFESEKTEHFTNGSCTECGSSRIEKGRDRIMIYCAGEIISLP